MKKTFLTITLIAGILVSAMMLSAFSKNSINTFDKAIISSNEDNCSFEVTDIYSDIEKTTVTIKVYIEPSFSPSEDGDFTVIVKPKGKLTTILDSQSQSVRFEYRYGKWYGGRTKYVQFHCSVNDNSYNQCNSNDFYVSKCFRE